MNSKMPLPMKYILMPTYGRYIRNKLKLKVKGYDDVKKLKGPAIVFANHVHTLDPFMISSTMPFHIRWVAGSYLFKMPVVSHLLRKWVSAIPKTQGRSDLDTIRSISKALKENDIIGLFPEGTRTWDGDTVDIVGGTAKLVRLFKVPVVFINIEGGYAKKPRWADKERKGPIVLNVKKVLTPEEIASMSLPEINKCVEENLMFSHDKWISENKDIEYKGPVAEGIERVLYACPCCGAISEMVSTDISVKCSKCNAEASVDSHYGLHSDKIGYKTIAEWKQWEKDMIADMFSSKEKDEHFFPVDKGILFQRDNGKKLVTLSEDFSIESFKDKLSFIFKEKIDGSSSLTFDFDKMESFIVNAKQTAEFFYDGKRYRFRPDTRLSTFKYQELYLEFQKHKEEK